MQKCDWAFKWRRRKAKQLEELREQYHQSAAALHAQIGALDDEIASLNRLRAELVAVLSQMLLNIGDGKEVDV